jgi:hypothetical protein
MPPSRVVARAEPDVGAAFLAIALEWVSADRGAEEKEIVEMGQPPLGAEAANVIDARRGRPADLREGALVEDRRRARCCPGRGVHQ